MFFKQTHYDTFKNVFSKKPDQDDVYLEDEPDSLASDEGREDDSDEEERDEDDEDEEDEEEPSLDEILDQEEFEDDEAWEMYKELHRR
jgi:hypothetical protein